MAKNLTLHKIMTQAKCPNMEFAEIEFALTHMLQALSEFGSLKDIAFKGGTCIRKHLSGPTARLSTDLDFTSLIPDRDAGDIVLAFQEMSDKEFHGFKFSMDIDDNKSWYITDSGNSVGMEIKYEHEEFGLSGSIRVQVSLRAKPILQAINSPQIEQSYFRDLAFNPTSLVRIRAEEMLSEKIRAICQREKTRDLYDLHWFSMVPFDRDVVRKLVVLKMWETNHEFDPVFFKVRLSPDMKWDWDDLASIVNGFDKSMGAQMLKKCSSDFSFLSELTSDELLVAKDKYKKELTMVSKVESEVIELAGWSEPDCWNGSHARGHGFKK